MSDTPPTALFEGTMYIGIILMSMLYGVYYVLFFLSLHFLKANPSVTVGQRRFYSIFSFVLVLLNTISIVGIALDGQMMWIVHRNDAGGPMEYYYSSSNMWWMILSNTCQSVANIFADLLLIYRCYVIFERNIWVTVFPFLCTCAFLVLYITLEVLAFRGTIGTVAVNMEIAMDACTVGMNFIVTVMICWRLINAYNRQKDLVDGHSLRIYTTAIVILIESAAPFCVLGIITCVTTFIVAPYASLVTALWFSACAISPQLIILRMSMSNTIDRRRNGSMKATLSNMEFAPRIPGRVGHSIGLDIDLEGAATSAVEGLEQKA